MKINHLSFFLYFKLEITSKGSKRTGHLKETLKALTEEGRVKTIGKWVEPHFLLIGLLKFVSHCINPWYWSWLLNHLAETNSRNQTRPAPPKVEMPVGWFFFPNSGWQKELIMLFFIHAESDSWWPDCTFKSRSFILSAFSQLIIVSEECFGVDTMRINSGKR